MQNIIQAIQLWIGEYGFFGVVGASIVEEVIAVIPSTLVQGFSGMILFSGVAFSFTSFLSFIWIVGVGSAVGVLVGSLPYVYFSRVLGIPFIEKYGKYIGVTVGDIEYLTRRFNATRWDDALFVFLRFLPFIPSVAFALYAGLTKMSWIRYSLLTLIGIFFSAVSMGLVGWFAGNQLMRFSEVFDQLGKIILVLLVGLGVWFLIWNSRRKKKKGSL